MKTVKQLRVVEKPVNRRVNPLDWRASSAKAVAMTKIPPGLLPEGLSDRLPPQAEASARLVRHVLDTVASHGYQRIMPPLAEFEQDLVARLPSAGSQALQHERAACRERVWQYGEIWGG